MQFNWNRRFAIMWQREKVLIFICTEIYVRTQSIVVMLKCKNIHVWALFLPLFVNRSSDIFGWPSWLFLNNIVFLGLIFAFFVNHSFFSFFDIFWLAFTALFSINIVLFGLIFSIWALLFLFIMASFQWLQRWIIFEWRY